MKKLKKEDFKAVLERIAIIEFEDESGELHKEFPTVSETPLEILSVRGEFKPGPFTEELFPVVIITTEKGEAWCFPGDGNTVAFIETLKNPDGSNSFYLKEGERVIEDSSRPGYGKIVRE